MSTVAVTDATFEADVLKSDQARARRFLGRMVRPLQTDRPGLEQISEELADRRDHRQGQYRGQPDDPVALRRARHPDHDAVQATAR